MAEVSKEPKEEAKIKEASTTPVFGSASTFGTDKGFGGFGGASGATPAATNADAAADNDQAAEEEECSAEFQPIVQLQEVETVSGEEAENILGDFKCKLYRFDHGAGEWKERGIGQVRLLENKENQRIRLLHRQEKTLKIRANHILMPNTKLQEHTGNEKAWVWSAVDFADEVQKPELFCIRFASVDRAKEFKKGFESAVATNTELLGDVLDEPSANGDSSDPPIPPAKTESLADELVKKTENLKVEAADEKV